jgi:hypothetical protein
MKPSAKRAALLGHLRQPPPGWKHAPTRFLTISWERTMATPDWAMRRRADGRSSWGQDTYIQFVHVTMVTENGPPLMRVMRAPWVSAQDSSITLAKALAVIADPVAVLDPS